MGFLQHLGDDLKSIVMDDFEVGVESVTDVPVVYLDPKDFNLSLDGLDIDSPSFVDDAIAKNNITDQDIQNFRASLEEQRPGFTDEMTDHDLAGGMLLSAMKGPFAAQLEHEGERICLVNKLSESFDEKHEIANALAHLPEGSITNIPGDDNMWHRAIGIHEGVHCSQEFNEVANPNDEDAITLTRESEADLGVYEYFEYRGENEFVQAMKDYRAIGASDDPTHATTALIDDEVIHATPDHIDAAEKAMDSIILTVQEHLGYSSPADVGNLATNNPEEFTATVNHLVDTGEFDANPILKEYVEDMIDAYERQDKLNGENKQEAGLPQEQAAEDHHSHSHQHNFSSLESPTIIHGELQDKMEINGSSASEFFNSKASPDQHAPEPEANLEQQREHTITQPSYTAPTFG
jgi:hypothetical protein